MMGTSVQNNDEFDFMTPQKGGGGWDWFWGVLGEKKNLTKKKFFTSPAGPRADTVGEKKTSPSYVVQKLSSGT